MSVRKVFCRAELWVLALVVLIVCTGGMRAAMAQRVGPSPVPDEVMERPSQYGVRFTPDMARAMGRIYARQMLVRRYELDESKIEEAGEFVARRLMSMAHKLDEKDYNEAFEVMFEKIMQSELESHHGERGIKPGVGQAVGEAIKPMMPMIRELTSGVARDVRPMLAPKQQLKLATDLMGLSTMLDGVEQVMGRWSEGDVRPDDNPFRGSNDAGDKDEQGRSRALRRSEAQARHEAEPKPWNEWQRYVEQAKAFYAFDDAQTAAADSILREATDRAKQMVQDDTLRSRLYQNRLCAKMLRSFRAGAAHPLKFEINQTYVDIAGPIVSIGQELKERIDAIPTYAQKQAAEDRMTANLREAGYVEERSGTGPNTSTEPASETNAPVETNAPGDTDAQPDTEGGL